MLLTILSLKKLRFSFVIISIVLTALCQQLFGNMAYQLPIIAVLPVLLIATTPTDNIRIKLYSTVPVHFVILYLIMMVFFLRLGMLPNMLIAWLLGNIIPSIIYTWDVQKSVET